MFRKFQWPCQWEIIPGSNCGHINTAGHIGTYGQDRAPGDVARMDHSSLLPSPPPQPGHVLSMPHDDSKPCVRLFGPMGKYHMMAPFFTHVNKTLPWSPCSAVYITELLDDGHGTPHSAPLVFSPPICRRASFMAVGTCCVAWGLPAAVLSPRAHRVGKDIRGSSS